MLAGCGGAVRRWRPCATGIVDTGRMVRATVLALEALGRGDGRRPGRLYAGDAGEKLAEFLRGLVASTAPFAFAPDEWPEVLDALIAPER